MSEIKGLRILHLEDSTEDHNVIKAKIESISEGVEFECAESSEQAFSLLGKQDYDCILTDYRLRGISGLEFLRTLRERGYKTPVIVLTGRGDEEVAAEALRAGAHDYFQKRVGFVQSERLLNSIKRSVREHRLEKAKDAAEEELRFRVEFEKIISTLSSQFISMAPEEIDNGIIEAFKGIGEFIGVDQIFLFSISEDGKDLNITYDWFNEAVETSFQKYSMMKTMDFPWWMDKLRKLETVYEPDFDSLSNEGLKELSRFEPIATKSIALVPMALGGKLMGVLGLNAVRERKSWSEETVSLLQIVSEMVCSALERKRSHEAIAYQARAEAAIARLSEALLKSVSLSELSNRVLEAGQELTDSPYGFVGYIDTSTGYLVCPTMMGDIWEVCRVANKDIVFREFKGLWGWLLENNEPILSNDASKDSRYQGVPNGHISIERFIGAPAAIGEKAIGIVALANSERPYAERDLALVRRLGHLYALCIQSKRQEEEILSAKRFLEMEVEERISELRAANEALKREVNERVLIQKALESSEVKYRSLFENSKDAVYISTKQGRILDINPSGVDLFGYSREELLSMNAQKLYVDPKDRQTYVKVAENLEYTVDYPTRYRRKDGKIVYALTTSRVRRDDSGAVLGYEGIIHDITERKLAEEALRDSEERFRSIFENVPIGVYRTAPEGRVLMINPALYIMMGYENPEEWSKIDLEKEEQFPASYNRKEFRERIEKEGEIRGLESVWKRSDGKEIFIRESARAILNDSGNVKYYEGTVEDVSERILAEQELMKSRDRLEEKTRLLAEANEELEAFSYSVSHDLREPLRHISGFAQLLLEDYAGSLDEKGDEYIKNLHGACSKMEGLISDMLRLSRLSRGELALADVDLSLLVKKITRSMAKEDSKRKVDFDIADGVTTRCDERLIQVALENLLANAWKFTSLRKQGRIEFGATEQDGKTTFFVKDNGIGFDMKKSDKLFLPFQRLHSEKEYEGSGIGLATVQRVVKRHGGRVWAEAKPDKGATFFFTLD